MTTFFDTFATPFGRFSVAVDASGAVVATAFGGCEALLGRLRPAPADTLVVDAERTAHVRSQILAYAAGERRSFALPLRPAGTPFQKRVWKALQRIRFGDTASYGDLARRLDTAPRAVGRANALNPLCLIIPCHRVIGADGAPTGFAFGVRLKQRLLAHESAGKIGR